LSHAQEQTPQATMDPKQPSLFTRLGVVEAELDRD
jgi:hypothetical protein